MLNLHAARPGIRTVEFSRAGSRAARTFVFTDLSGAMNLDALWIAY